MKLGEINLVLLAERPKLGSHFGWVKAGVRCCRFDPLGVVLKLNIRRSLESRLVLLYKQYRVLHREQRGTLNKKKVESVESKH